MYPFCPITPQPGHQVGPPPTAPPQHIQQRACREYTRGETLLPPNWGGDQRGLRGCCAFPTSASFQAPHSSPIKGCQARAGRSASLGFSRDGSPPCFQKNPSSPRCLGVWVACRGSGLDAASRREAAGAEPLTGRNSSPGDSQQATAPRPPPRPASPPGLWGGGLSWGGGPGPWPRPHSAPVLSAL